MVEERLVRNTLGPAGPVRVGETGERFQDEPDDVPEVRVRAATVGVADIVRNVLPVEGEPEEREAAQERRVLPVVGQFKRCPAFLEVFRVAGDEPPEQVRRRHQLVQEGRQVRVAGEEAGFDVELRPVHRQKGADHHGAHAVGEGEERQVRVLVLQEVVEGEHVFPDGLVRVIRRNADATRSVRGPVAEEVHAGADIPVLREEDGLVFEHLDVLGEPVGDHDDADGVLRVIEVAKAVERDARFGRRGEGKVGFLYCHFHFLSPGMLWRFTAVSRTGLSDFGTILNQAKK